MSQRTRLEVIGGGVQPAPASAPAGSSVAAVMAAAALLVVGAGASVVMKREVDALLSSLDAMALEQAAQGFDRAIDQQRRSLISEVAVLAEDARVRATVMATNFDENTVRDVLDDMRKGSAATMLAVLDTSGKVRAVSGAQGLRGLDLGSSAVVKAAMDRPGTDVWTFPDQVLVVGVAPVRSGNDVSALFVMGFEIGAPFLSGVQKSLGVGGAVLIRDRVAAASANDAELLQAVRAASGLDEDHAAPVRVGAGEYVARVGHTSNSAASGKVVWVVARHHETGRIGRLAVMSWVPAAVAGLAFLIVLVVARRRGAAA